MQLKRKAKLPTVIGLKTNILFENRKVLGILKHLPYCQTITLFSLFFQEGRLPKGSYVFLTALADGRVLYDNLYNRTHPIGSLKNDVTYSQFYDYFNCLQVCLHGCGNTMPDLSDLVPFHSGQVENFYLLALGQVQVY